MKLYVAFARQNVYATENSQHRLQCYYYYSNFLLAFYIINTLTYGTWVKIYRRPSKALKTESSPTTVEFTVPGSLGRPSAGPSRRAAPVVGPLASRRWRPATPHRGTSPGWLANGRVSPWKGGRAATDPTRSVHARVVAWLFGSLLGFNRIGIASTTLLCAGA